MDEIREGDKVYVFKTEFVGVAVRIESGEVLVEFEDGERRWYSIGTMFKSTKDETDGRKTDPDHALG